LAQRGGPGSTGRAESRKTLLPGPRLTAEQELELVAATERGDRTACRQLVDAFLPAIGGVARRFGPGGAVPRADLMQAGVAGLLFAARRYDPRMKTPFWGYASFWVRKAMQDVVAEVARPVALSDHAVRNLARVRAARRDHVQARGAEPTKAELAAATGFTPEQLDSLLAIDRPPRSFDEPLGGGGADAATTPTLGDTVADPDAEQDYEHVLDEMEVHDFAGRLDERERAVLWAHYGLGEPAQTLSTIGARLGLTAERIRQIEVEAFEKLRHAAAEPPDAGGDGI
jgi:RNA polymerase primary sigma factor